MGTGKIVCDALLAQRAALGEWSADLFAALDWLKTTHQTVSRARPRPTGAAPQEIQFAQIAARIKTGCQEASLLFDVTAAREEQRRSTATACGGWSLRSGKPTTQPNGSAVKSTATIFRRKEYACWKSRPRCGSAIASLPASNDR